MSEMESRVAEVRGRMKELKSREGTDVLLYARDLEGLVVDLAHELDGDDRCVGCGRWGPRGVWHLDAEGLLCRGCVGDGAVDGAVDS